MKNTIINIADRYNLGWTLLTFVGGLFYGFMLISGFRSLTMTYATFFAAVLAGPFIIFIVGDSKRILWAILMVCLPVTVDFVIGETDHISGASGYLVSVYDMTLGILYFLWLVEMVKKKNVSINFFPQISIPAIFLIGISAVSMIFASHPGLSKFELVEVIKMYLAFFYLANNIKNVRDVKFIVCCLVAGLLFEGILGVAQHRYSEPFFPTALGGPGWVENRVSGSWLSYNDFAFYLDFMIPLAICMLFTQIKPVYKLICCLALITGGGALIWTASRGGWISLAAGILFVCPLVFSKIRGKQSLIKIFASIIAVLLLISPIYPRFYNSLFTRFTGDDGGSAESRFTQFEVAYDMIGDNLFVGVGLNNFTEAMYDYDSTPKGLDDISPHAVHNIYLHIAAETGLFGIASFAWLMAILYIKGLKYILSNNNYLVYVVIGLLAGVMTFLVHGLADTASLGSKLFQFVWFFTGVIFAIINIKPVTNAHS